jgi:hypothetical protein
MVQQRARPSTAATPEGGRRGVGAHVAREGWGRMAVAVPPNPFTLVSWRTWTSTSGLGVHDAAAAPAHALWAHSVAHSGVRAPVEGVRFDVLQLSVFQNLSTEVHQSDYTKVVEHSTLYNS